jgi:hypothetical protein
MPAGPAATVALADGRRFPFMASGWTSGTHGLAGHMRSCPGMRRITLEMPGPGAVPAGGRFRPARSGSGQARAGRRFLYAVTPSGLPDVRSRLMRAHLCGFRCLRVRAPRRCAVFPPGNAGFLAFLLMWFLPGAAV